MNEIPELIAFGQHVSKLREKAGKTQFELASDLDIERSYISLIETGRKNVTYTTLLALAEGLGVSIAELVTIEK